MRFLTLLAVALPLASSVPTDTKPSLNPPLQSTEKRGELSCGLVGYDKDKPAPFLVKTSRCSVTNCASLCKNKPTCKSYSISNTKCSLYSAPVAGNFVADADSAYKFYDKDCSPCDSPDGFRLRLEDKTGALYGYVSNAFNQFGERTTTDDLASALAVGYKASSYKFKQLDLIHKNSAAFTDLTHLSGIVGFSNTNSNLGPGLYK
ncbi:hypothetical protein QQX98_006279 [Neonectria punicea]|uniref:Apple domain-containing protein n=1 Tax=Neonectria punicea TaxID=979145 RepID=A0ABR1H1I6_9HYPO